MAPIILKVKGDRNYFRPFAELDNGEDLCQTWKVCTKVKDALENGSRLENLSWRLWYLHQIMVDSKKMTEECFKKVSSKTTEELDEEVAHHQAQTTLPASSCLASFADEAAASSSLSLALSQLNDRRSGDLLGASTSASSLLADADGRQSQQQPDQPQPLRAITNASSLTNLASHPARPSTSRPSANLSITIPTFAHPVGHSSASAASPTSPFLTASSTFNNYDDFLGLPVTATPCADDASLYEDMLMMNSTPYGLTPDRATKLPMTALSFYCSDPGDTAMVSAESPLIAPSQHATGASLADVLRGSYADQNTEFGTFLKGSELRQDSTPLDTVPAMLSDQWAGVPCESAVLPFVGRDLSCDGTLGSSDLVNAVPARQAMSTEPLATATCADAKMEYPLKLGAGGGETDLAIQNCIESYAGSRSGDLDPSAYQPLSHFLISPPAAQELNDASSFVNVDASAANSASLSSKTTPQVSASVHQASVGTGRELRTQSVAHVSPSRLTTVPASKTIEDIVGADVATPSPALTRSAIPPTQMEVRNTLGHQQHAHSCGDPPSRHIARGAGVATASRTTGVAGREVTISHEDPRPVACQNCGVTSTPLWRRSSEDQLLCNACGLYYKLHKQPRPRTMRPNVVRKIGAEDLQSECFNCMTRNTPLWRRDEDGHTLCNACGLYLKLHRKHRPISMKTDIIRKRTRYEPSSGGGANDGGPAGGEVAGNEGNKKAAKKRDSGKPHASVGKAVEGLGLAAGSTGRGIEVVDAATRVHAGGNARQDVNSERTRCDVEEGSVVMRKPKRRRLSSLSEPRGGANVEGGAFTARATERRFIMMAPAMDGNGLMVAAHDAREGGVGAVLAMPAAAITGTVDMHPPSSLEPSSVSSSSVPPYVFAASSSTLVSSSRTGGGVPQFAMRGEDGGAGTVRTGAVLGRSE